MCLSPHTCLSNKSCGNVIGSIHTVLLNVYGNYLTLQRGGNHLKIIKLQLSYQIQYSVHFRISFFFYWRWLLQCSSLNSYSNAPYITFILRVLLL